MTQDVKGKAELIVAKHRNGPIGTVDLAFQSPYPRFRNMSRGYRDEAPAAAARRLRARARRRPDRPRR